MHRGCISLGEIECDGCHRAIPYLERYLVMEDAEGQMSRVCVECCQKEGYVHHKQEKGKQVLTLMG
ncbi:hypothetical protein ACFLWY_02550 [Chloroflexota bacterium]